MQQIIHNPILPTCAFSSFAIERVNSSVKSRAGDFAASRRALARAQSQLAPDLGFVPHPSRPGQPVTVPAGFIASLSHSRGLACALIACAKTYRGVGIDCERVDRQQSPRLWQRIATPPERQFWESGVGLATEQKLVLCFSAKESLYKALNPLVGRYFGFQSAEILEQQGHQALRISLTQDLSAEFQKGRSFTVSYGFFSGFVLTQVLLEAAEAG